MPNSPVEYLRKCIFLYNFPFFSYPLHLLKREINRTSFISYRNRNFNMVEIIQIRHEHQSSKLGFQKELGALNWCVRKLRVTRSAQNTHYIQIYYIYIYFHKKLKKHQSSAFFKYIFLKKIKIFRFIPRSYINTGKLYRT